MIKINYVTLINCADVNKKHKQTRKEQEAQTSKCRLLFFGLLKSILVWGQRSDWGQIWMQIVRRYLYTSVMS